VDRNAFQAIRNVRQQLARAARTDTEPRGSLDDEEPALREAIFVAYADRVGKRRSKGGQDVVFADGGAAKIAEGSVVRDAEFLVAIDVDEGTRTGPAIRVASAIEPEWLLGADGISDVRELAFDAKTERVVLRTRLMFGKLTLDESDRPAEPSPEAHAVLLAALRERGLAAVWDLEGAEGLLARWRYAASVDDSFPKADEGALETLLLEQMSEATSFAELRAVSPLDALSAGLGAARLSALRDLAPEFVNLPGRPRVPVNYEPGKPPWMESRLQDFFGMAEGPRVGRSREAIVIHLLAPNYRAVQVTTDLAGFWERHYPALRSQLMRRYPRHAWPEDPLHATPPQRQR
jgi:ATP-dependent helicase HrpB